MAVLGIAFGMLAAIWLAVFWPARSLAGGKQLAPAKSAHCCQGRCQISDSGDIPNEENQLSYCYCYRLLPLIQK
jgi:hypothetical protein